MSEPLPRLPFPGPGIVYDMPSAEYHAIDAVSSSVLKILDKASPMHALDYIENGIDETDEMHLGTVAHTLLLEPLEFPKRFIVGEACGAIVGSGARKGQPCGNDGKICCHGEWLCGLHYKGFTHDETREVVTLEEMNRAKGINFRCHQDREADRLLCGTGDNEGRSEVSMFAVCPVTGLNLKIRLDRYLPKAAAGMPVIADIKKCQSAGYDDFLRTVDSYRYHIQAAFYCWVAMLATGGIAHETFEFIAVEGKAPHAPACWLVSPSLLDLGMGKITDPQNGALAIYKACRESGSWPSYHSHRAKTLDASPWMVRREQVVH